MKIDRFKDIPKFVVNGHYWVDHPLDQLENTIARYKLLGFNMDPDFQRGHVWTEQQQISYIEFLLRGGESSRSIFCNHPGWQSSYAGDFVLVDGKQRLNACLRFIRNEIPAFGTLLNNYKERLPMLIGLRFNINTLKTRAEVLQWYLDLNTGGTIHTNDEIEKVRELLKMEFAKNN